MLIGAYRCLQVGTGGRCLVIFKSAKKLSLKQLKFEINSLVMLLKEMNLQILALLFQDLPKIQILALL